MKTTYFPAYRINGNESVFTDKCETKIEAVELAKVIRRAHPEAEIGYAYFDENYKMVFVIHSKQDAEEANKRGHEATTKSISGYQHFPVEGIRTDSLAQAVNSDDAYRMKGEVAFGCGNEEF